jgi:hypothetical protein
VHIKKAYGEGEVQFHSSLATVLGGDRWSSLLLGVSGSWVSPTAGLGVLEKGKIS